MRPCLHLLLACALGLSAALPATAAEASAASSTLRLQVWFSNDRLNPNTMNCSAVFPVERRVPATTGVASATLRALFAGPTPQEAEAGYRSVFSPASSNLLKAVHIRKGTAFVDMHDLRPEMASATSSCGAAEFQAQVSRSLKRFPGIQRVVYAFDGQPRNFYEWMNESCGPANGHCDPAPFSGRR